MKRVELYSLKRIDDNNYLVILNDFIRVDEILGKLSSDLKTKKAKGDVVLDTFLTNGNTSARFIQVFFDGNALVLSTLKKIPKPADIFLSGLDKPIYKMATIN